MRHAKRRGLFAIRLRTMLMLVAVSAGVAGFLVYTRIRPVQDLAHRRVEHYGHAESLAHTYAAAKRRLVDALSPLMTDAAPTTSEANTYLRWKREVYEAEEALQYCRVQKRKYTILAAEPWRDLAPDPLPPTSTAKLLVGDPPAL